MKDSVALIEEWDVSSNSDDWVDRLPNLDDDQIVSLTQHLADGYWAWEDNWRRQENPNLDFLVFGHPVGDSKHEINRWLSQAKSTALCFDNASISDPLAEKLWPPIQAGVIVGLDIEHIRMVFRERLPQLLAVKPLRDEGALKLVPQVFIGDTEHVQNVARSELSGQSNLIERADGIVDMSPRHSAFLSAVCYEFDVSPIATNKYYQDIIAAGLDAVRSDDWLQQIKLEDVISDFAIPNLSQLPVREINALRRHSEALTDIRTSLTKMVDSARIQSNSRQEKTARDLFSEALSDGLKEEREKIKRELEKSDALQNLVVPGAVNVGFGLASYFIDPTLFSDPEKLLQLMTLSSPGITWILYSLLKQIESDRRKEHAMYHFYGQLLISSSAT